MDVTRRPSHPRRARLWLAAALFPMAMVGCEALGPTARDGGVTRAAFIEVIVALREAERELVLDESSDSAHIEFAHRKEDILQRHGVSEDDLRQFVTRHRDRPAVMTEVWDQIAQRLGVRTEDIMEGMPSMEALPDMGDLPGRGDPPRVDEATRMDGLPREEVPLRPDGPLRLDESLQIQERPTWDGGNPLEDIR
jgi:hypothetical protein